MADNNTFLTGSICLTDIPVSQMKKVMCKDGKERVFLNVAIFAKKQPQTFGDRTYTHFISCAPKKEERIEGENYIKVIQTSDTDNGRRCKCSQLRTKRKTRPTILRITFTRLYRGKPTV